MGTSFECDGCLFYKAGSQPFCSSYTSQPEYMQDASVCVASAGEDCSAVVAALRQNAATYSPTKKPTPFPSFAPTEEATNPPKPEFDPSQFDRSGWKVIGGSLATTNGHSSAPAPTTAPTAPQGYVAVPIEKEVAMVGY